MSPFDKLSLLIYTEGGLSSDYGGLECLSDVETGKVLLDWLASQLDSEEVGAEGLEEEEREQKIFTSMRDLVLEKEEALLLNQIKSLENTDRSNGPQFPQVYVPPSRLQKHAEYINAETDLVQREGGILRTRISQTKEACNRFTQSIMLLQRAVFDLDSQVHGSEERLTELSINADTTLTSTLNTAGNTLRCLVYSERKEYQDQEVVCDPVSLHQIQSNLSKTTTDLRKNIEDFASLREREFSRIEDLQADVQRLQRGLSLKDGAKVSGNKISKLRRRSVQENLPVSAKELEDICMILEREVALKELGDASSGDAFVCLLSELEDIRRYRPSGDRDLPVLEVMQTAWTLDQENILNLQEEILDEALSSYDSGILSLKTLHASLSDLATRIQDTEAVLEALGEELGEIYLDTIENAKPDKRKADQIGELEKRVKLALNEFKGESASQELHFLLSFTEDLGRRPSQPALPRIYSNSLLNTTPPFAYPVDLRELEARTRTKTSELHKLANSLEEEVREALAKQSHLKRLTGFVEKYAGI
ncbi:hypothetical protein CPB84DRAFT_1742678 [Gymnopilus junonius]|uniref:HAUS augmin-like complex subunit 3 n=1 Tax=Gymnopilus junonius TaxID=109634 RepID=A0A9P5NWW1_GYMJU|nr:hypothetical protein CPB84DRAFT_1742678 [Gymnopilus junonius]